MPAMRILASCLLIVCLNACGNKGDLFLVSTDEIDREIDTIDEALNDLESTDAQTDTPLDVQTGDVQTENDTSPDSSKQDDETETDSRRRQQQNKLDQSRLEQ